ncbi:MAG: helix-turn-helix domain-containing protein [Desulfobulbus sp.]|jgi:AraC-like DNA-binding protein
MEIGRLFMEIDPYRRLEARQLAELAFSFQEKTWTPGMVVVESGHPVHWFGLIQSGVVEVSGVDEGGEERSCAVLHGGDMIFTLSLMTGMAATVSMTCRKATVAWVQPRDIFMQSMERYEVLKEFFYEKIMHSMQKTKKRDGDVTGEREETGLCADYNVYVFWKKMMQYLDENYQNNATVEEVARDFAMNRFCFAKKIKNYTGLTYKQHLNRKRIAEAKKLLARQVYNVTETAYAVGFNDSSYFARIFREHEGCSPREYQSMSRNKA